MGTVVAISLLIIAIGLIFAVRRGCISNSTLETWANIATVVALVAAVLVFVVPTPSSPQSTSVMSEPTSLQFPESPKVSNSSTVPTQSPTPDIGTTRISPIDGMVQLYVPAGEFLMGSSNADSLAEDNEKPDHIVFLDAFWIDKTEVTNAQYSQCVETGNCQPPLKCDYGEPTYNDSVKQNHPVVCVGWAAAERYCSWSGRRLPTEAEWEKAARGIDGRIYPWGNIFYSSAVNFCDQNCEYDKWNDIGANDGYASTAPADSFSIGASPYGALNMAGNVYEWVSDWYDSDYYQISPSHNPQGPPDGAFKVLRGGSWDYLSDRVRVTFRFGNPPLTGDSVGFRCVQDADSQ